MIGERGFELLPDRGLCRPRGQGVARQGQRVFHPGDPMAIGDGGIDQLPAGIGKRDQMPGQIAAIDRRDVFRLQRPQVARVVPVEEMPAEALELAHGGEGRLQPVRRIEVTQPGEVAGGEDGEQVHADIRRRGAMRDGRLRVLLKIVGRKHVVLRRHEALEEMPGASRDQPQGPRVGKGHGPVNGLRRRLAHPARDRGREKPEGEERCCQRQRARLQPGDEIPATTARTQPPAIWR